MEPCCCPERRMGVAPFVSTVGSLNKVSAPPSPPSHKSKQAALLVQVSLQHLGLPRREDAGERWIKLTSCNAKPHHKKRTSDPPPFLLSVLPKHCLGSHSPCMAGLKSHIFLP